MDGSSWDDMYHGLGQHKGSHHWSRDQGSSGWGQSGRDNGCSERRARQRCSCRRVRHGKYVSNSNWLILPHRRQVGGVGLPLPAIVEVESVVWHNVIIPVHHEHRFCNDWAGASTVVDTRPYCVDIQGDNRRWRGRGQEVANGSHIGKGRTLHLGRRRHGRG